MYLKYTVDISTKYGAEGETRTLMGITPQPP